MFQNPNYASKLQNNRMETICRNAQIQSRNIWKNIQTNQPMVTHQAKHATTADTTAKT